MTWEEIWKHAEAKRLVRWSPSGAIEKLRVAKNRRVVIAEGFFTSPHVIATLTPMTYLYQCEVVPPSYWVSISDLLEGARRTRYFRTNGIFL